MKARIVGAALIAALIFGITAFCAFEVSNVSVPHLIGGVALGGVGLSVAGLVRVLPE